MTKKEKTEMEKQIFEPGELFIYRKAPGVYELGVAKWKRDDNTWFCLYSSGDTAAATPVAMMRKLTNAHWAPIEWANLWGGHRLTVGDLLQVIPARHTVIINQNDVDAYRHQSYVGTAYNVPDCFRDLPVIGVRSTDWMIDIEVCDG